MNEIDNEIILDLANYVDEVSQRNVALDEKIRVYGTLRRIAHKMPLMPCLALLTVINYATIKLLEKEKS